MASGKVAGVGGIMIFKEFRKPLEDLLSHPSVREVSTGATFNRSRQCGLRPTIYDPTIRRLKVVCHSKKGCGQEVFVSVREGAVQEIRDYIANLNQKYFG